MLLLGGKTTLNGVHHVRRHAMPPTSTGNPLQEGGDLSVPTSHKSSPITRPNRARYRAAAHKQGRGRPAKKRSRRAGRQGRDLARRQRTGCLPLANAILAPLPMKIDCQKQPHDTELCRNADSQYWRPSQGIVPGERLSMGCLSDA